MSFHNNPKQGTEKWARQTDPYGKCPPAQHKPITPKQDPE